MAFGKKVQACGVMAGPRLDEVQDNAFRLPSRLNSTWGGNFTDMVRSTHFLRIIEQENLVANAAKVGAHFSGVSHEIFLLDDAQKMSGTHHVGKVSAPGGVKPARQTKGIILNFIQSWPCHHSAGLDL